MARLAQNAHAPEQANRLLRMSVHEIVLRAARRGGSGSRASVDGTEVTETVHYLSGPEDGSAEERPGLRLMGVPL